MHLYPQRRNVAAQVAEELKTVIYATPPMEERRNPPQSFREPRHDTVEDCFGRKHTITPSPTFCSQFV